MGDNQTLSIWYLKINHVLYFEHVTWHWFRLRCLYQKSKWFSICENKICITCLKDGEWMFLVLRCQMTNPYKLRKIWIKCIVFKHGSWRYYSAYWPSRIFYDYNIFILQFLWNIFCITLYLYCILKIIIM